jgi:PPK2 family polyphosphate:nucleotide phosphotransferase
LAEFNAESAYRVKPRTTVRLRDFDPSDTRPFRDKDEAVAPTQELLEQLETWQMKLFAESQRALLIVFQGMDTSGKDGATKHIFRGVNPQGCAVTSFKTPTAPELAQDFLWREHQVTPARGMMHIFNRSHYEAVLAERVLELVPKSRWSRRYRHINEFESMLVDEGTTVIKFFLHISRAEQKQRLEDRLKSNDKRWKFDPRDLELRKRWTDFQHACEDALSRCSTADAPWYVIPANRKWYRNWAVTDILVRTLERMAPKYPKTTLPKKVVIPD